MNIKRFSYSVSSVFLLSILLVPKSFALGSPVIHQGSFGGDFVSQYLRFAPAPGTVGYNIYLDGEYKETWHPDGVNDYIIDTAGEYCAVAFNPEDNYSECSNSITFNSVYGQYSYVPPSVLQNTPNVCITTEVRVDGRLIGENEVCY